MSTATLPKRRPTYQIQYHCPRCEHEWEEFWTAACDSECPSCGLRNIEALKWEEVKEWHRK